MGHAELENQTPMAVAPLFLIDEAGRTVCAVVVKATYRVGADGVCALDEEQPPVALKAEWWGEPGASSLKTETEAVHYKPACDVVVIGHARSIRKSRELLVAMQVGRLKKGIVVVGDRVWYRSVGSIVATAPVPFDEMPLVYERAFGGSDRESSDERKHGFEPRNPVGVGFRARSPFRDGLRLPNLEDPAARLSSFGQRVTPTGCGYVCPQWQPRATLAGTYDDQWQRQRMPGLPQDFDSRYFNAASPGLIADGYLRGDEGFTLVNVGPRGSIRGRLPGTPPPTVQVHRRTGATEPLALCLDTVVFWSDLERVQLIWRGHTLVKREPHEIDTIEVESAQFPTRTTSSQ